MDGSKRTFFLVVSLCVFLAALGVSASRLVIRYTENFHKAQAAFQTLQSVASRSLALAGPSDEAWRSAAKKLYRNDDSVLVIALHAPGKGLLHMVPRSAPYLSGAPESATRSVEFLYPPQTVSRLSAVVGTSEGAPITLDLLYALLRQSDVYEAVRLGLMIAAAWTAFSLLVVTIAGLRRGASIYTPSPAAPAVAGPNVAESSSPDSEFDLYEEDFTLPEIPPIEPETGYPPVQPVPEAFSGDTQPSESVSAPPKGLFSSASGLGWEEYLAERLEAELSRAASFEQDLVLLRLSHEGVSRNSPAYGTLIKTLLEFFSFRDLAFEQGSSGLAVILPNMDSEHALRMAEEFLKKTTAMLRSEGNVRKYQKLFIGLSSRSGRLVDSGRLMTEAQAALDRARDADSRIVAFRADPNKYRAFLASRE